MKKMRVNLKKTASTGNNIYTFKSKIPISGDIQLVRTYQQGQHKL